MARHLPIARQCTRDVTNMSGGVVLAQLGSLRAQLHPRLSLLHVSQQQECPDPVSRKATGVTRLAIPFAMVRMPWPLCLLPTGPMGDDYPKARLTAAQRVIRSLSVRGDQALSDIPALFSSYEYSN